MVEKPSQITVFFKELYWFICFQEICYYLSYDWAKFEAMAWTWRANKNIFVLISPINQKILSFCYRIETPLDLWHSNHLILVMLLNSTPKFFYICFLIFLFCHKPFLILRILTMKSIFYAIATYIWQTILVLDLINVGPSWIASYFVSLGLL